MLFAPCESFDRYKFLLKIGNFVQIAIELKYNIVHCLQVVSCSPELLNNELEPLGSLMK